jgi:hypothetical protein
MRVPCTYIDGIGSSQTIDTHGEVVDLEGLDISTLVGGALSWEHEMGESKGNGQLQVKVPQQIVGKIVQARKIFSEKDCLTDRHHYYWNKFQIPFLYIVGRLFDDQKPSAIECAALFKDDRNNPNETPMVSFSVEGSEILKEGPIVKKSIARKVTITNLAANKTCLAQILPMDKQGEKDEIASLFKGEMVLFQFEPTYTELMSTDLKKAMTAGSGMAAPAQLEGGAALAKEDLKKGEKTNWYQQADDAYKTWDKREHFRGYMKKRMPHLAEGEIDAIGRMVALKKTRQAEGKLSKMYASYFGKAEGDLAKANPEPTGHAPGQGEHSRGVRWQATGLGTRQGTGAVASHVRQEPRTPGAPKDTHPAILPNLQKGTDLMMASEHTSVASSKEVGEALSPEKHPHSHEPISVKYGQTKPTHSHTEMLKPSFGHAQHAFDHTMHAARATDSGDHGLATRHRLAHDMHARYGMGDHKNALKIHTALAKMG